MRKVLLLSAFCLLVFSLFHLPARAQDLDEVTFAGQVADEAGALIPGARVEAEHVGTGGRRAATTDAEGRYRLIELAPGLYRLRATAPDFAAAESGELKTLSGQNLRIDFTLRPAGVAAEQIVTAESEAAIDTTRTIVGGAVAREEIENLPLLARAPLDLVFALPGVSEEPLSTRDLAEDRGANPQSTPEEAGLFALAGGAAYSNNLTVDGHDNNDDRAARERVQPSVEAVEEVQVIANELS